MSGKSSFFGFCSCGRPLPCTSKRCNKNKEVRKKIGRYSGYSKAFVANRGSEEIMEDET